LALGKLELGERMRARRRLLRKTQQNVADAISVTRAAYAGWESGRNEMGATDLPRVATALRTTVAYLLDEGYAPSDVAAMWCQAFSPTVAASRPRLFAEAPLRPSRHDDAAGGGRGIRRPGEPRRSGGGAWRSGPPMTRWERWPWPAAPYSSPPCWPRRHG